MLTNHNQKWITDTDFKGLTPLNLFRKENAPPIQTSHREDLKNRHMMIRKKFIIEKSGQKAEKIYIYITADDYYKLYINEKYVGQGPAPAYHFRYNMNKYDITDFLEQENGENIIAVHVYYQGLVNRVWNSGDYRMGMTAQIISGTQVLLSTDSSWKYETAREFIGQKTIGYETQFIEDIDNRNKIADWKSLSYDDSGWSNVSVNEQIDYTFFMQETPPLQVYNILPANITEITNNSDKKYIVDFGQEITGRLLMSAKGNAGDIIKIGYGEELENSENPNKVKSKMRCNCDYNEKWILSGEDDKLEPYDYKAFRYVEIDLEDTKNAEIILPSVCAEVRHYPFDDTAVFFKSSNNLLNSIWEICKNGVKYGTQEGYLDCPSREKGQYLGDSTIVALSHAYLTGDYRIYKKCLIDFAQSCYICPGMMATSPGSWMQEIADYSLQYPLQLWNYYRLSGDSDLVLQLLPIAEGIINYFKRFARADGLIENYKDKPVIVDWPSNLRDNYDYELMPKYQDGCNTVLNAFYIGAVQTVNEIKAMLKIPYCENEIENLKKSFIAAFFDDETKLFTDSEVSSHSSLHANALPLFYNIVPKNKENDENKNIIEFIKQKRLCCGVYFAYFVLKALARAGEYDFVFELLVSQDEHSWGNMVKEGATTCFEAWGKGQKWNTSLCHPWASTPIIVLIEDIIGNPQCECEKYMDYEIKIPSSGSGIL